MKKTIFVVEIMFILLMATPLAQSAMANERVATTAWAHEVNQLFADQSAAGTRRELNVVTESSVINERCDPVSHGDGDVCQRLLPSALEEALRRIVSQQGIQAILGVSGVAREWRQLWRGNVIWLCEAAALMRGGHLAEYRHVYLFESGRGRHSSRLLLDFMTHWSP